ncbi:MAG: SCO family protein, partial [Alphaproteobacteria bacterium]|nr:SCO family protein [Alphaproteobacteria bacterium]
MVQQDGNAPKLKRTPIFLVIGTMLVALVGIAVAAWIAWSQIAEEETAAGMAGAKALRIDLDIGGPFKLTNHLGETVTDASYRGRFMLVYFGYTYCPDVCPTELANMATALAHLGKRAERIQPLFITVDPARDTADMLAGYVSHFHPQMQGLT